MLYYPRSQKPGELPSFSPLLYAWQLTINNNDFNIISKRFMAESTPVVMRCRKKLLSLAIASSSVLATAQTQAATHTEWQCLPVAGQWQCGQRELPPTAYPPAPLAPIPQGKKYTASTEEPNKTQTVSSQYPWDWVPKADLKDPAQCKTGCDGAYVAPTPDWPDVDMPPEQAPLRASGSNSRLVNKIATIEGDVTVSQGQRRLRADKAVLDRSSNQLVAEGNIELREPNLLVQAERVTLDLESSLGEFKQARFLQHDKSLRGSADTIARRSADTLDLEQAMYTQCSPDDEAWKLEASSIHLDNASGWGSARNARLNIGDVPIFYTPYLTFPIDDRRMSGLLWPSLGSSSSNGFELTTPYYLNLAPNYDATIAPRYIEERGTMTELELRQLSRFGHWELAGAYLEDELYRADATADGNSPPREKRWIGNINHEGNIGEITTLVDYTKVSDQDFFSDLSTNSLDLKRATHLNQKAAIGYGNRHWLSQLLVQDYQTVDPDLEQQYQLLPRLTIERYNSGANFELEWLAAGEFTQFDHDQSWDDGGTFTTGDRSYGETGFSFPMRWASGFLVPTAKVRNVSYQLDATAPGASDSLSATSPLGSLDMGLIFERDGGAYRQTLEPRLFYLYSDYDWQAGHPNFDSRELDFSYSQLFRETRFSGHDRLDDSNQLSAGLTSRFIDQQQGREFLSLSLGQIFYFEDRRVYVDGTAPTDNPSNSYIAGEIQYQPANQFWLTNTLLWDSRQDLMQEGGVSLHYQDDSDSLYNLGYRYRRAGVDILNGGTRDLSQADASMALPVSSRWNLYARYHYDLDEHRAIDDMFGLRYEDCCWAVNLLYQRGIKDEYLNETTGATVVETDRAFVLEFQLKGLGSLGGKAYDMLKENILGYEDLEQ